MGLSDRDAQILNDAFDTISREIDWEADRFCDKGEIFRDRLRQLFLHIVEESRADILAVSRGLHLAAEMLQLRKQGGVSDAGWLRLFKRYGVEDPEGMLSVLKAREGTRGSFVQ